MFSSDVTKVSQSVCLSVCLSACLPVCLLGKGGPTKQQEAPVWSIVYRYNWIDGLLFIAQSSALLPLASYVLIMHANYHQPII